MKQEGFQLEGSSRGLQQERDRAPCSSTQLRKERAAGSIKWVVKNLQLTAHRTSRHNLFATLHLW